MGTDFQSADEGRHDPDGADRWNETWYLDFADETGDVAGYVQLTLWPALGRSWFWACLTGRSRRLVAVIDNEAPIPRPPSLELRAPGLWADLICETPAAHFTVGLEAFGVALDDPLDVFRGARGDRTPLGFDLEWESGEAPAAVAGGYRVEAVVHGEVLVGAERLAFDGSGCREHRWGAHEWWTETGRPGADVTELAAAPVLLEGHPGGPTRLHRVLVRAPTRPGTFWLS